MRIIINNCGLNYAYVLFLVIFLRCIYSIARVMLRICAFEQRDKFSRWNRTLLRRANIYALSWNGLVMDDNVMTIENTPEMRSFIQLWMMSGSMVLSTVNQILEDGRTIELPAIPGRDLKSEIIALSESFNKIVSRLK